MAVLRRVTTWIDIVLGAAAIVAGSLLVLQVVLVGLDALFRSLSKPVEWGVEINTYVLLGLAVLSAPWALRRGDHFRVTLAAGRLGPAASRLVETAVAVLLTCVAGLAAATAATMAWNSYARGQTSGTLLRTPLVLPQGIFALGLALLTLAALAQVLDTVAGVRPPEQTAEDVEAGGQV